MSSKRAFLHRTGLRPSNGLARALSKLGLCSRSQAKELIRDGKVRVNGEVQRDPERPIALGRDRIEVDGRAAQAEAKVYLVLNKPRGLVTTSSDEHGRATVFQCLANSDLSFVSAVGRLDKASEGLLLLTNDTTWAARITDPASQLKKTYHVQVDCLVDEELMRRIIKGAAAEGEFLAAKRARLLKHGSRNSWIEIVLDEGRNRHIRRLLAAFGIEVLRLVRVAIGPLPLGVLAKGQWRHLTAEEVKSLTPVAR